MIDWKIKTADGPVDDHLGPPSDGRHDLADQSDRALAMVELPSAMVRDVDAVDAVIDADRRGRQTARQIIDERTAA